MRKIKSKFLTICALFLAAITCTAFGVFTSIENKEEITVAKAENIEVMNKNWTATPTLRWDLWNSMYKVTLSYTSAFNPTTTWANDHSTVNGIDVRDYLVFNGETLKEIQAKGAEINTQYPVSGDEGMLDNGATWNPVAVCVNTNNIEIQINRNYLAPAGLEFGIKDGFSMTNGNVTYQTDGDVMFKLIPSVSNKENVEAVRLDAASVTTKRSTFSVSRMSGWDKTNYDCYHIVSTALMNYGNDGRWLCDHFTYLNDYITINGKPLAYWNTVTYDASYNYAGAPATSRVYATPTFGQMYQSDTSTTIAVYLNRDWMAAQGIASPELGIKDGMLYVGRDGKTVYEEGTPTEVMNDKWTITPTLRWDLWNSMYKVTLSYTSAFNPTAAWVNNAAETSHVYALRDYLVLNGKTLGEIISSGSEINTQYPVSGDEGMLDNGATWNPVAVCVNTNNIEIQINRNYLAPAGLEFGIKDGFSMTNNGVEYKVVGDMMFKLIPSTSNVENVTAVKLSQANITANKATFTVSNSGTTGNYTKYQITTPATMAYGNNGRWLCDHFTYLNDYITVNGKPLAYWNTVKYNSSYNYTGAPLTSRQYATPTFGQMYAQDGQTIMFVYVNNDLGLTDPEIGIADGMLYVGIDGVTVYKFTNEQDYEISFEQGASIRYITDNNADSGIRFTANVAPELATVATEVGMLIVPETYISAYKASGYTDYFTYFETVKGKAKSSISVTFDGEQIASGILKGCIVGIKDVNWNRAYQAVTYYIAGGEYYYSAPSDARTIAFVADKAVTDTEADYSDSLRNSLATIVKKSIDLKYADTATVSGAIGATFNVNDYFNYGLAGDTAWTVVSGTAVKISGSTCTISESGEVVLRFSAYDGRLTKDVTLNVECTSQSITVKSYYGGNAASAPAFTMNETTGFASGNFYVNDTTNTTNGTMILNGEEKVVFQGGSYNASNGAFQFTSLASGVTLSIGDVITLKKGTTISQGSLVYVIPVDTCLKYYNASNWIVYTLDGEISVQKYYGGNAATAPAFLLNEETGFTSGSFYVNNTMNSTNGNMILNGVEKVVFQGGSYNASNGAYQFINLASGVTLSAGDVLTLKKGTTFSQGDLIFVLSKNAYLTYTGSTWTVMNADGEISVARYYGGNAATAPAFSLNETTEFVSGNFYINDTTNTTNGTMILNGEKRIVFKGGSYNASNGAYQFVNLVDDITFVANDLLILEKGTTFSQGDLVYIISADTYLMYTGSAWTLDVELQTLSLDSTKAYALSNAIVSDTDLALDSSVMDVTINGNTTVDGSSANLTAIYYPSPINKFMLKNEGMTGEVVIPAGSIFVIENSYYALEEEFLCYVEAITIEDANAEYYTFADLPPRGWEEFVQHYLDLGLSTYQLTTDCFQFITDGALDATYTGAIDLVDRLGGNTLIRNMGLNDVTATVDYFDSHGAALVNGWGDKISGFYMADEYTSAQYTQLGDLITWKNTYASDSLWHMNMVGSLSYDHWDSGFTGNWWQDLGKNDATFQATYGTHVDDYINNVVKKLNGGTASVCLDCYPFRETGAGKIYNYYLYDLLTVANKTKAYNDSRASTGTAEARFGICLQTYQFIQPNGNNALGRDIASAAEVSMQIYTGLAMGADLFEYFAYCSSASSNTNGIVNQGTWDKTSSGDRLYDYVKTANDNALPFAKITMAYDWLGTFVSAGTTSNENASAFNLINGLVTSDKGAMTSISSTYDAIIGRYEGSEGDGYMVVNYTDPTKAHTNTVNMNFNGYNYAIIYTAGGEAQLVALNAGALSLSLAAGEAAFVIPMA